MVFEYLFLRDSGINVKINIYRYIGTNVKIPKIVLYVDYL